MDDPKPVIRCPMCGKENDAASKRCTFCRAVLHEFDISEDTDESSSSDDWLSSLRDAGGSQPPQEDEIPAEDSGQSNRCLLKRRERHPTGCSASIRGWPKIQPSLQQDLKPLKNQVKKVSRNGCKG